MIWILGELFLIYNTHFHISIEKLFFDYGLFWV